MELVMDLGPRGVEGCEWRDGRNTNERWRMGDGDGDGG